MVASARAASPCGGIWDGGSRNAPSARRDSRDEENPRTERQTLRSGSTDRWRVVWLALRGGDPPDRERQVRGGSRALPSGGAPGPVRRSPAPLQHRVRPRQAGPQLLRRARRPLPRLAQAPAEPGPLPAAQGDRLSGRLRDRVEAEAQRLLRERVARLRQALEEGLDTLAQPL